MRPALLVALGCLVLGVLLGLGLLGSEFAASAAWLVRGTALFLGLGAGGLGLLVLGGALRSGSRPVSPRAESASALLACAGLVAGAWYASSAPGDHSASPANDARDVQHVEVLARQFEWIVRYPGPDGVLGRVVSGKTHNTLNPTGLDAGDPAALDDVVRRGALRLPAGRRCIVHLRSLDVLHRFNVHGLGVERDVLPGYPTEVQVVPSAPGSFELSCAALCGLGHYRMRGTVEVVRAEAFDAWLAGEEPWL